MAGARRDVAAGRGSAPAPRAGAPTAVRLDERLLLEVLTGCACAQHPDEVGAAALLPLAAAAGVRAGLVLTAPDRRADPAVLASVGYDCSTMAPGAVLPLTSGLPVTEALRTGRTVVAGDRAQGPSWVAVPVPRSGSARTALLLSLHGPPPEDVTVGLLGRLAGLLGPVLDRAAADEQGRSDLLVLEGALAAPVPTAPGLAVRSRPHRGLLTGDVVVRTQDRDAWWLLVADVSGSGHAAAVLADRVRTAFRAQVPGCRLPSQVLQEMDAAVAGGEESFVTALVLRVEDGVVAVASAGHPAPVLRRPDGATAPLRVQPGPPLGLGLPVAAVPLRSTTTRPRAGSVLVAWTDGLADRGTEVDVAALVASATDPSPDALADALLERCDDVGPAQDDVTVVVQAL